MAKREQSAGLRLACQAGRTCDVILMNQRGRVPRMHSPATAQDCREWLKATHTGHRPSQFGTDSPLALLGGGEETLEY